MYVLVPCSVMWLGFSPSTRTTRGDKRSTLCILLRYHGFLFTQSLYPTVKKFGDSSAYCLNLAINFIVAMANNRSPIKYGPRMSIRQNSLTNVQSDPSDDESCVNVLMNTFGHIPLLSSATRAERPL